MIKVTRISNADKSFDENWAIVRKMKSSSDWLKQVPELSPSPDLFSKFLDLKSAGNWNKTTFQGVYVPQFISELKKNVVAREKLNYLYTQDKAGKGICLVCFCTDESLCHRSIIAGILAGGGCCVQTDTGLDYSHYYEMYKNCV